MENFIRLCLTLVLFSVCGTSVMAQEQGEQREALHVILRKHARALGRLDAFQKFNSYVARGTLLEGERAAGIALYKREGRLRLEVETAADGQTVIVYDGKDAWKWSSLPADGEVIRLNRVRTDWLAREAHFEDILLIYDKLGFKADYLGRVPAGQSHEETHQIRLTQVHGAEQFDIYLNTLSFLEMRRYYRPAPGEPALETVFSDYREVSGIMVPFHVENLMNGILLSAVQLKEVEVNAGILKFYFQIPAGRPIVEQPEQSIPDPK